jgi:hypothetical protein
LDTKQREKLAVVFVGMKNGLPVITTSNDVIQTSLYLDPQLSCHHREFYRGIVFLQKSSQ